MKKNILFLIIFIEGYAILSIELLAIRQALPFVGNSVEILAVILSVILLPLSLGYYFGGEFKETAQSNPQQRIKKRLAYCFLCSGGIVSVGLSYTILKNFFYPTLNHLNIHYSLWQIGIYGISFLVIPNFLLGQTLPLLSTFLSPSHQNKNTGTILFFSTLGSFCGATLTTIVFMPLMGVHNTIICTVGLILIVPLILSSRSKIIYALTLFIFLICIRLNNAASLKEFNIITNNVYSTTRILNNRQNDRKTLIINGSRASYISDDLKKRAQYVQYIERNFIQSPPHSDLQKPKDILICGAGGFTIGLEDAYNHYLYVDIDKELKKVSEEHFLNQKLSPNKEFLAVDARNFLNTDKKLYDIIVIDVYQNRNTIPEHLVTKEFFLSAKSHLKENGVILINIVGSLMFQDPFSVKMDNTLRDVFYPLHRQGLLSTRSHLMDNTRLHVIIFSHINSKSNQNLRNTIYTDNKNSYFTDISHTIDSMHQ